MAELVSLPSGLLAMVCEAIVKLKVRLGLAGVRARAFRLPGHGTRRGPTRSLRANSAYRCKVGAVLASRGGRAGCGVLDVLTCL